MHTNLRSLKLIIIDEVSMLSNLNLAYIHLRLEELFGGSGDEYFGSMNMLFVGDILQLPRHQLLNHQCFQNSATN